jgi:hypothetical protein
MAFVPYGFVLFQVQVHVMTAALTTPVIERAATATAEIVGKAADGNLGREHSPRNNAGRQREAECAPEWKERSPETSR